MGDRGPSQIDPRRSIEIDTRLIATVQRVAGRNSHKLNQILNRYALCCSMVRECPEEAIDKWIEKASKNRRKLKIFLALSATKR